MFFKTLEQAIRRANQFESGIAVIRYPRGRKFYLANKQGSVEEQQSAWNHSGCQVLYETLT